MRQTKHSSAFIRTDHAIEQAFIRLLRQKSFEELTVQDLLDETPVTRGTFYAHYRDKYEIAERMMERLSQQEQEMLPDFSGKDFSTTTQLIESALLQNRTTAETLLRIHTDTIHLEQDIRQRHKEKYLRSSNSPHRETEAEIYAGAMTTLQLLYFTEKHEVLSDAAALNSILTEVFLQILHIEDPADRTYVRKHLAKVCKEPLL